MGAIELELRCPRNVNGMAADPQPDWSFDNLLSELDSIENKFTVTTDVPSSFTKTQPQPRKLQPLSARGFVMRVSDHELDYPDYDSEEEADTLPVVTGTRFTCDEPYMSDDSENELPLGMQCQLMDKVGLAEGALCELTHELQLSVVDEVRNRISALETDLVEENEMFTSRIAKAEKLRESLMERERKFDLQYRRTIAEALDNHLTAVQRDHEHISQLEERRIRDDREEAKRKEKALQEEKLRQEMAKAEEEARFKAESAKAAALKAEKQAVEEAEAKRTAETLKNVASKTADDSRGTLAQSKTSGIDAKKNIQSSARNIIRASENALELEKRRRQIYDDFSARNESLKASNNQDFIGHGQNIGRRFKTISATVENIRTRVDELVKLINSPGCPRSISIQLFAEKAVSNCKKKSSNVIFSTSRVIVLVASKVPEVMDILIAELNKTCIYSVPKHIDYSEAVFTTKDAYRKAIGYEEQDGRIESTDEYLEKLSSYMKLYGALVQTEVGVQNLHGLGEGWAWLARFLNAVPPNLYTAVALYSFLEMAGFALYRRYKNQFEKLMKIVALDFISALKESGSESWNAKLKTVKLSILNYVESNQFKKEPEGLQLRGHLDSHNVSY